MLLEKFHRSYAIDPNTGCWNWTKSKSGGRYPVLCVGGGKQTSAHRFSLEQKLGRPIKSGYQALHRCDNAGCVNPNHLYEGTQLHSMAEKIAKGRHPTRYKTRSVSDDEVRLIRMYAATRRYSQYAIAEMFGTNRSVVLGIHRREKYKDVSDVA